ncbi:DNA adenine methylase, partial [Patescibacteria group bacterium]|nr:DNA adenine methylase [Patescibacteria group bacterium]
MTSNLKSRENSVLQSPLRFPGSKRRIVGYIKDTLVINGIKPSLYVEPFIGGGSVALQLLQDALIEKAILMDIDPWIASFWQTVFFDTDWLIDQIQSIEVTIDNWYRFKKLNPKNIRDQAITCFFLNRTNFSGILEERVGPIGGKNQKSKYKIDCRFSKENLISRIQQAAELRDRVYGIWNCSWDEGFRKIRIEQKAGKLPKTNLFFYLDPPFFEEADALYR